MSSATATSHSWIDGSSIVQTKLLHRLTTNAATGSSINQQAVVELSRESIAILLPDNPTIHDPEGLCVLLEYHDEPSAPNEEYPGWYLYFWTSTAEDAQKVFLGPLPLEEEK